jgi:tetratricopeptide (TPR) repeat protein
MSVDKRHLLKSAYNYTQAGQWDRALDEYRKITRLFPDDANIHSMIADLLSKRGDAAGACREHMEAARLFKAQEQDEKELSSLRKALRAQAGDGAASEALRAHFTRALQQATRLLAEGKLAESEAIANRLLDAEPGNLDANHLLDDLKAAQAAVQARQAMAEEAAAAPPPMVDAAAEVIQRLEGAVAGYLAAEDFDNAIETMLVILKLDPGRTSVQVQLAQAQAQLMATQAAQHKWEELQRQSSAPVVEAKVTAQDVDLAAWRDEEEAVRKRLE